MLFKAVTYNIHGGLGKGERQLQLLLQILKSVAPQVICLQEVKQGPTHFGYEDQGQWLGKQLGYRWAFAPARTHSGGVLGNAVLSAWPIRLIRNHDLTILTRAPRACLEVEVETPRGLMRVFNLHLGHLWRERVRQIRRLWPYIIPADNQADLPLVLAGDFNTLPRGFVSHYLRKHLIDVWRQAGQGRGGTYSSRLPLLRLDYIYINQKLASRTAQVVRPGRGRRVSDHFPLLAELDWAGP